MDVLGVDIGGSGIKGAPVDLEKGRFAADRLRVPTPQPATPGAVAGVVADIVRHFGASGPVGVTFPGVIRDGVIGTAANLGEKWVGTDGRALFGGAAGAPVALVNDADAAGIAEMTFGAGRGERGTVVMVTFGTGIGSALFHDGRLVPNTEFGHLEIRGKDAERRASAHARETHAWSWPKWAEKVAEYLCHLDALLAPSLIIIGGGVSRKADRFLPYIPPLHARVTPAELHNTAGIIGAATIAAPTGP